MDGGIYGTITRKLSKDEPKVSGRLLAAVSVILRSKGSPEVLLIKRAERQGDPWSGQVAFPGGRMQEGERTAREVAIRETLEEVGVNLAESSEFLGYYDSFVTHTGTMNVVPSVYLLNREVEVKPNGREVSSFIWADLARLFGSESRSTYRMDRQGQQVEMPAFLIGDYVVWGLTYRILTTLAETPDS